jgi:hypothetical protein
MKRDVVMVVIKWCLKGTFCVRAGVARPSVPAAARANRGSLSLPPSRTSGRSDVQFSILFPCHPHTLIVLKETCPVTLHPREDDDTLNDSCGL